MKHNKESMTGAIRAGRILIAIFRPLFFLLFPYSVKGREYIPSAQSKTPLILCGNHISDIDPVFILMAVKRPIYFMAKAELFPNGLARWFFTSLFGAFPVQRGKGDSGAIDKSVEIIRSGKIMGIFPEGTRSRDGNIGRAKSGAALIVARSGASVLPVAISSKEQKVRLFRKTRLVFGPVIPPDELCLGDPEHPDLRRGSRMIMDKVAELL